MKFKNSITRRKLFEGVSSAILLGPLMRILRESDAYAAGESRALFVYYGAGTYGSTFWPTGNNCNTLPATTAPLLPHKDDLVMFRGLNMKGPSNHDNSPTTVFTGYTKGSTNGTPYSIDYMLGDLIGGNSVERNLAIGLMTSRGGGATRAVGFNKAGKALPAIDNPKAAFDEVFGGMYAIDNRAGSNGLALADQNVKSGKKRILDYVKGDMKRIENSLGPIEGKVFEAHVTALDELSEEIRRAEMQGSNTPPGPVVMPNPNNPNPMNPNPNNGMAMCGKEKLQNILPSDNKPQWYHKPAASPSINKFNRELMMHAFLCNITRVGFMQYAYADCAELFHFEDTAQIPIQYHSSTHENSDFVVKYQSRILQEVATMVSGFKAAGLWDNTLVVFSTCIGSNPNAHDGTNIPCFMMGKMDGKLKGNRVLDFPGVEHNKFLTTAMHLMGQTQVNHMGNTSYTGILPGVF